MILCDACGKEMPREEPMTDIDFLYHEYDLCKACDEQATDIIKKEQTRRTLLREKLSKNVTARIKKQLANMCKD